ncbi:MAG: tagatose 1,6-diphosphate aldolase [Terriglobia bacterium]
MPIMTPGKLRGLQAVSTGGGVIAALALDQRGSLAALMTGSTGREPTPAMLREFKSAVTESLTPEASAILLDLELGGEAAARRAHGAGLILTYEKDAYINRTLHRIPELIPGLSVKRLKEAGADCVKLLIHYNPDAPGEINQAKRGLVEKVGAECVAEDIPLLLEVLGYDAKGNDEKGVDYARRKPEMVTRNMAEFSQPSYAVDVLKVEIPVNVKYVAGAQSVSERADRTAETAYSRQQAIDFFRQSAAASSKPFIYLSAGVSHAAFVEGLSLAGEAGAPYSGVLCGRAIWQEGARVYAQEGRDALNRWINDKGQKYIRSVTACLKNAQPWYARADKA